MPAWSPRATSRPGRRRACRARCSRTSGSEHAPVRFGGRPDLSTRRLAVALVARLQAGDLPRQPGAHASPRPLQPRPAARADGAAAPRLRARQRLPGAAAHAARPGAGRARHPRPRRARRGAAAARCRRLPADRARPQSARPRSTPACIRRTTRSATAASSPTCCARRRRAAACGSASAREVELHRRRRAADPGRRTHARAIRATRPASGSRADAERLVGDRAGRRDRRRGELRCGGRLRRARLRPRCSSRSACACRCSRCTATR